MRQWGKLLLILCGAAGVAAGGYITLAIIVAQSRTGHYLHSFNDVFGWKSLR
ncbi:MAG: hypothetical protein HY703_06505 [Gemmatimonadetes bacterium]|nr:hypothetical protein [Gemmatimonadota bacterium]